MQQPDLEKLILPELDLLGFECVKLEIVGSNRSPVIRLFIDKPGGVTVGDCARVSRTLGLVLDREDPFPARYLLEVSSPGNNRPLVTAEHFQRFAGRDARVTVSPPGGERVTHTGKIVSCADGVVVLATESGEVTVSLGDVVKANLANEEYAINKKREKDPRPGKGSWRKGDTE